MREALDFKLKHDRRASSIVAPPLLYYGAGVSAAEPKRPRTGPDRRSRSRFDASRAGSGRGVLLCPVVFAVGVVLALAAGVDGGRASAQETIYIGDGGIDVIVNLGALNGLGREGPRPVVIDPAMTGGEARPLRPRPPVVDAAVATPVAKVAPEAGRAVPEARAGAPEAREPAAGKTSPAAPARPLAAVEVEPAPAEEEPAARTSAVTASPADTAADTGARVRAPDSGPDFLVLRFPAEDAALPPEAERPLARLAGRLGEDERLRLRLKAYASGDSGSASQTRRLSLSRALAVRAFLIEQGVRSTRIDLRALGDRTEDEPADRVDILVVER